MTHDAPTVAVTGAAGYIGSRIVYRMHEVHPGWEIEAIDNFYRGDLRRIGDVSVEHVDIRDRDRLGTALQGADVVVHLAALSGLDSCSANPDLAYEVNVVGTGNVAWFCHRNGAALAFPFSMQVLGDPDSFPVSVDQPRDPKNVYGRTKVVGERTAEALAEDSFPAYFLLKSNVYGEHVLDDRIVTKGTVVNYFVDRAVSGESLTVYEPGTQARNYVHIADVADAYVRSVERLLELLDAGETGARKYEIASDECPSVMSIAELVRDIAREEANVEVEIELVENPRADEETLVEEFPVDTSDARDRLGWDPERSLAESIRSSINRRT